MTIVRLIGLMLAVMTSIMIGCQSVESSPTGGRSDADASSLAAAITIQTFNIWVGGTRGDPDPDVSLRRTLDVMKTVNADVICVQEQKGFAERYAADLGYRAVVQDDSTAILTRLEIDRVTDRKWGARLRLPDGSHVWIFNVHFPAAPYQPYQLVGIPYHDGRFVSTVNDAVTEARLARGENALRCLRDMQPALRSGEPVFVCGDFNEPSHLDWTAAALAARDELELPREVRSAGVAWPTTALFHEAGFRDAYREIHSDPAARRGYTWSPRPDPRDVMDRIDLILFSPGEDQAHDARGTVARGDIRVVDIKIIGESPATSDVVIDRYPSDHRSVVATVELSR